MILFACAWLMMTSSYSGSCGVHGSSAPLAVSNDTNDMVTIDAEDPAAANDVLIEESDDGFGSASLIDELVPGSETPDGNLPSHSDADIDDILERAAGLAVSSATSPIERSSRPMAGTRPSVRFGGCSVLGPGVLGCRTRRGWAKVCWWG